MLIDGKRNTVKKTKLNESKTEQVAFVSQFWRKFELTLVKHNNLDNVLKITLLATKRETKREHLKEKKLKKSQTKQFR